MLANGVMFGIEGATSKEQAQCAWSKLKTIKKSKFALEHAIEKTDWSPPSYILDGLRWLASGDAPDPRTPLNQVGPNATDSGGATAPDG